MARKRWWLKRGSRATSLDQTGWRARQTSRMETLFREWQGRRGQQDEVLWGHVVGGLRHEQRAAGIDHVDRPGVGDGQQGELTADPPQRLPEVHRGDDRARDREQQLRLANAPGRGGSLASSAAAPRRRPT
jgi:hypothetical protein